MAKKSMILKQQAPAKFSTRKYNRCKLCGRPHAYLRDYDMKLMMKIFRSMLRYRNRGLFKKDFDAVFTFWLWMLRYRSRRKFFSPVFTFCLKTVR